MHPIFENVKTNKSALRLIIIMRYLHQVMLSYSCLYEDVYLSYKCHTTYASLLVRSCLNLNKTIKLIFSFFFFSLKNYPFHDRVNI